MKFEFNQPNVFSEKKDVKIQCMYVAVQDEWPWMKGQNSV